MKRNQGLGEPSGIDDVSYGERRFADGMDDCQAIGVPKDFDELGYFFHDPPKSTNTYEHLLIW